MIVFDTSTLVGAASRRTGVPHRCFLHAIRSDRVAVSDATLSELREVLARPRLSRFVQPELREQILTLFATAGVRFLPRERVADCRDPKDNCFYSAKLEARRGGAAKLALLQNRT